MKHLLPCLLLSSSAVVAIPFGEQVSESGIRHRFLLTGTRTCIVEEDGAVAWEVPGKSRDGEVLANGHVLIAFSGEVKEFTEEMEVVFHYKLSTTNREIGTVNRLSNGNTLITELGARPRLLEVTREGVLAVEVPLQPETDNAHMQTRMARKLGNGNYLVPHLLAFAIKEYTPEGRVVRTIRTDLPELGGKERKNWPFTAIMREDGKVVANLTNGNKTVVFGRDGEVVWVATNEDVANRFADPCGGQLLANGNMVICAYGQGKDEMPDVFEITPEKVVVWEFKAKGFRGAHEIHVLTTNGKPCGGRR